MAELTSWWPLLGIGMMRPLGTMLLLPIFSSSMLGGIMVRNALALVASFPVLPFLLSVAIPDPLKTPGYYMLLLGKELCIGLMIGFSAAIAFWALDMAGFILDTQRGASMAGIFNPLLSNESSQFGSLFSQLAAVLFMYSGGFHALYGSLYDSYALLPPAKMWQWRAGFLPLLKSQWHELYNLALSFAMPAIVIMILIDLALGLINRSAQQINVFTLSMPLKCIAVVLMLLISLKFGLTDILLRFEHYADGLILKLEYRP